MVAPIIAAGARAAAGGAARREGARAAAGTRSDALVEGEAAATEREEADLAAQAAEYAADGRQSPQQRLATQAQTRPRYRVNEVNRLFLFMTAAIIDGLQIILALIIPVLTGGLAAPVGFIAAMFLGVTSFLIFTFWFFMLSVFYLKGPRAWRRLAFLGGMIVVEGSGFVSPVPAVTFVVYRVIRSSRKEDREAAADNDSEPAS